MQQWGTLLIVATVALYARNMRTLRRSSFSPDAKE